MSILEKAKTKFNAQSLKKTRQHLDKIQEALDILGRLEMAPESSGPLQKIHSANCTASGPPLELIGIACIEVNPDGKIVQVERIFEEGGE